MVMLPKEDMIKVIIVKNVNEMIDNGYDKSEQKCICWIVISILDDVIDNIKYVRFLNLS